MSKQAEKAQTFRALHAPGAPVVLFNAWDPGSAKTVARAGARAIATGSWSVAAAFGYDDGEALPLDLVLQNIKRIAEAVDLPVTLDFERGYGDTAADVGRSVAEAIEAGAIGFNIEDGTKNGLRDLGDQAARLQAARAATQAKQVPAFINARTDYFLINPPAAHDDAMLDEALARGRLYAKAGADGLFLPGLVDEALITRACAQSPLPVNVMAGPGAPTRAQLAACGVARISHGPGPYRLAMQALEQAAKAAMEHEA